MATSWETVLMDPNTIILAIGAALVIGFCAYALKLYLDGRYPPIKILEVHDGFLRFGKYRRDGYSIIEGNPLDLIFGKGRIGENIKEFKKVLITGMPLPWENGPYYLAGEAYETFIPFHINYNPEVSVKVKIKDKNGVEKTVDAKKPMLEPIGIQTGQKVALRFIEARRFAMTQAKSTDQLIGGLIAALPVALIVAVMVIGFVLIQGPMLTQLDATSNTMADVAHTLRDITMNTTIFDAGGK